jgi:D-serine deaminase-like pyridoxal phosphate-dependent protein
VSRPAPPLERDALETPALLVDRARLSANITEMADRFERAGVALRPHVKTHKCAEIAALQGEAGANGFTVATLAEAEMMCALGHRDLLFAYPAIGLWRERRLQTSISFVVDSLEAARAVGRLARLGDTELSILWEVDCGAARCGTMPGVPSVEAAMRAADLPGIAFGGLFTFAGHVYGVTSRAELASVARAEAEALVITAELLADAGLACAVLSAGTTPTASMLGVGPKVTEMRPGNYVFYDASQVALGVATLEQCALTVLATVISRPAAGRLIVDAGSKAFGREVMTPLTRGYGVVLGHPQLTVASLYEEHGILETAGPPPMLEIGDRVEIVPNHACVAANLHDRLWLVQDEEVLGEVSIRARSWRAEGTVRRRDTAVGSA